MRRKSKPRKPKLSPFERSTSRLLSASFVVSCGGTVNDHGKDAAVESGHPDGHVEDGDGSVREGSVTDAADPAATAATAACNAINMALIRRYSQCDGRPTAFGLAFETSGFVEYNSGSSAADSLLSDLEYECSRVGADVASGKVLFDGAMLTAC